MCPFKAIVMVGLDGSGKTSILNQLINRKPGILQPTIPTIGMSHLEILSVGIDFNLHNDVITQLGTSKRSTHEQESSLFGILAETTKFGLFGGNVRRFLSSRSCNSANDRCR